MIDLKATIIYTALICVSVAVDNTLELQGDVVYGQSFNLVCFTYKNTSYYSGIFYRNINALHSGSRVAAVFYSNSCIVTNSSFTNYTYSCSNDGKNFTLTVPAENEIEHNTFWRCANQAFPNQETNNVIQVFVNDPVRSVTVRNNTVVNVTEGISETFICESSPCRPSADIYWMKNGINITDTQAGSSIYQSGTKNITSSYLRFTAVRTENGSLLACGAYNGYGTKKISSNVTVIVHYSPIVNHFSSPVKVIQGQPLEVVCRADGNPAPQMTWTPAGEDRVNNSRLYYSAVSRDKAVVHTCTATNTMVPTIGSPQIGSDSKQLLIDVLYSPIVKNFTSPVKVIQGKPLAVVCRADGNPAPQMTWTPAGEDRINKYRLYYSAISRDKAVIHTCTATNIMVPTIGSQQQGLDSKELLIDVLYSPIVNPFTLKEVIEGQPLVVVCSADGNPAPQMTWNPAGEDKVNRSRLYYSAISRDKAVVHTCTATNTMVPTIGSQQTGSDSKQLFIDVLYNASLSMFNSKDNISVVNENGSLQLQCQVDSNPYSVISLYLENDLKLEVENALNLSYTKTAACLDTGKYTCSARNKIMNGDAVSRSIQINVACYPRLDHRRNTSKEKYGALGDNVTMEVYVIAYPEPTNIAWYHREKDRDIWQMFSYWSSSSSGLYSSIIVHLATERDLGYYKVNMSNDFGIYDEIYSIIPVIIPGVPINFTVTVNGPVSVTLEWTPGFWGGHPQEFIIQYRIFPDGAWLKLDPIKDSGSSKQTAIITGLQQKTTYEFHLYAENIKGPSDNTSAIVTTPATTTNSPGVEVAGIAGGISAGLVVILVVAMGIFFCRRYKKRKEHDVKKMGYKYQGNTSENNRNADKGSPENDSYEKLHPYANNDIQMYSSLKIHETSKDSQKHYENS